MHYSSLFQFFFQSTIVPTLVENPYFLLYLLKDKTKVSTQDCITNIEALNIFQIFFSKCSKVNL